MEAPQSGLRRQRQRKRRNWIITGLVLLILLIIVIVVVVVTVSRKHHHSHGLTSAILIPLYIYPLAGAWEPLFEAINSNLDLQYTVIVNVDSGPGNTTLPNDDFTLGIQKLNSYPNVKTVGYVHTSYATRPIEDVLKDVATYAGWATKATGIQMHGIFFDEAPHVYSTELLDYMTRCNDAVRSSTGFNSNSTIIHNPGTIPDSALSLDSTTITVVFEQSYSNYQSQQSALQGLRGDRSRYSYMVNSIPSSVNLGNFVDSMSQHAAYLFATNRDSGYYENFASDWRSFVQAVPT